MPCGKRGKGNGNANNTYQMHSYQSISTCVIIAATHWVLCAVCFTFIISFNPCRTIKIGIIIAIAQMVNKLRNRPQWQNQDLEPRFVCLQNQPSFCCTILFYCPINPHRGSIKWTVSSMKIGTEYLSCSPLVINKYSLNEWMEQMRPREIKVIYPRSHSHYLTGPGSLIPNPIDWLRSCSILS